MCLSVSARPNIPGHTAYVLSTNTKLHTGFQLLPKSVTLNDLEQRHDRRSALSLRYLSFLLDLGTKLRRVNSYRRWGLGSAVSSLSGWSEYLRTPMHFIQSESARRTFPVISGNFSARLTLLGRVIAKGGSVCLCVCLSVTLVSQVSPLMVCVCTLWTLLVNRLPVVPLCRLICTSKPF